MLNHTNAHHHHRPTPQGSQTLQWLAEQLGVLEGELKPRNPQEYEGTFVQVWRSHYTELQSRSGTELTTVAPVVHRAPGATCTAPPASTSLLAGWIS